MTLFDLPLSFILAQLTVGLVNGSFYAILSLGLAIIFGMLNIVNFAHGAMYTMGAFFSWMFLQYVGVGYWPSLLLVPLCVGVIGIIIDRFLLKWIYKLDPVYGLLLTFGVALVIESIFREAYGFSGLSYPIPQALSGPVDLGFMFLPMYRGWVIVAALSICLLSWLLIEKTQIGAYLRAGTEKPQLTQAFGINVPLIVTLTYGLGVALAGFAGVLAAPIFQVSPMMGQNMIIIVFAVVVIGGMGSILGAILSGLALGLIEGLARVIYPEASSTVIFLVMVIVLLSRPYGLFGREA